jgi:hypothetical protein
VGNAYPTFRHVIKTRELQSVQTQQAANCERRLKRKKKGGEERFKVQTGDYNTRTCDKWTLIRYKNTSPFVI